MTSTIVKNRVITKNLVSSRYDAKKITLDDSGLLRPASWDERVAGQEVIETTDGEQITLFSNAQQASPQSGWILALTGGSPAQGFTWTLYGLKPAE